MPETLYKCGICGGIWSSKSKAEECEDNHKEPIAITGKMFMFDCNDLYKKYPWTVSIRMSDGNIITYKRG